MPKTKFKLNLRGLNEIMKNKKMQGIVKTAADQIAKDASTMSGEKYSSDMRVIDYVAVGTAFPASKEAARDNYENNTLLKAKGRSGLSDKK